MDFVLPALLLGLKHSFDPDHLLAVSNFLARPGGSVRRTLGLTTRWTAGHLAGAAVVTAALYIWRDSVIGLIAGRMDLAVGLMLISFGALAVYQSMHSHAHSHGGRVHTHPHGHGGGRASDHSHLHIFGIGVLQGLASNDELLLLLTVFLGLSDLAQMAAGVAVFSAGVFLGMNLFGFVFTVPAVSRRGPGISDAVNLAVGAASVAFGAWMLAANALR